MKQGTITNWWLLGTGLMLAADTFVRMSMAETLVRHSGSIAGAMVLVEDLEFGLAIVAVTAVYSALTRSSAPFIGTLIGASSFVFVVAASHILVSLMLTPFGMAEGDLSALFFAESLLFVGFSCVWRNRQPEGSAKPCRQPPVRGDGTPAPQP